MATFYFFRGRSSRSEFWYFVLIQALIFIGLFSINYSMPHNSIAYDIFVIYYLISILPFLAVTIRRLHDTGESGWMILVKLIPIIGSIFLVVMLAGKGQQGSNQYGEDPNDERQDYDDLIDDDSVL